MSTDVQKSHHDWLQSSLLAAADIDLVRRRMELVPINQWGTVTEGVSRRIFLSTDSCEHYWEDLLDKECGEVVKSWVASGHKNLQRNTSLSKSLSVLLCVDIHRLRRGSLIPTDAEPSNPRLQETSVGSFRKLRRIWFSRLRAVQQSANSCVLEGGPGRPLPEWGRMMSPARPMARKPAKRRVFSSHNRLSSTLVCCPVAVLNPDSRVVSVATVLGVFSTTEAGRTLAARMVRFLHNGVFFKKMVTPDSDSDFFPKAGTG